jgi:hypothetical protein
VSQPVTITCKYSCKLCRLKRVKIQVPARQQESVTEWMEKTVQKVAADHQRRRPGCPAKELTEFLIPITGTDRVGGPTVQ